MTYHYLDSLVFSIHFFVCGKRLTSLKTCCIYAWEGRKIFTLSHKLLLHISLCSGGG